MLTIWGFVYVAPKKNKKFRNAVSQVAFTKPNQQEQIISWHFCCSFDSATDDQLRKRHDCSLVTSFVTDN